MDDGHHSILADGWPITVVVDPRSWRRALTVSTILDLCVPGIP